MAGEEIHTPTFSTDEGSGVDKCRLNISIPGLKSSRALKISKGNIFPREASNGVVEHDFKDSYFSITFSGTKELASKKYVLESTNLPGDIVPEKCAVDIKDDRIEVTLYKKEAISWIKDGIPAFDVKLPD